MKCEDLQVDHRTEPCGCKQFVVRWRYGISTPVEVRQRIAVYADCPFGHQIGKVRVTSTVG